MAKFICRSYDAFDNETFEYIAFADKASAKAYRRRWDSPGNVDVCVYASEVSCPLNISISKGNPYFQRLELDSSAEAVRDLDGKRRRMIHGDYHDTWMHYWGTP